jgi:hypothetical protein
MQDIPWNIIIHYHQSMVKAIWASCQGLVSVKWTPQSPADAPIPNCFVECFRNLTSLRESNSSSSTGSFLLIHKVRTQTSRHLSFRKRSVGTHLLKSAHVPRLRGSTAVTGADGSPCGVIVQMMGGIVAVLIEDSKRERNMSMIPY